MNFLAHFHLAEPEREARIGHFLGDFVRGKAGDDRFSEGVWKGIVEHRQVDAITDCHPLTREGFLLLQPEAGRLAGIAIDIFYDHFLTKNWDRFSSQPFEEFVEEIYDEIEGYRHYFPDDAKRASSYMVRQNWLCTYQTRGGILTTLMRVSHRSPLLSGLPRAIFPFEKHYDDLQSLFLRFYPDLLKQVRRFREEKVSPSDASGYQSKTNRRR